MKTIYINQFPNGEITYSSSLFGMIKPTVDSGEPTVIEVIAEDAVVDNFFDNPNDYIVDIINKTITKK